MRSQLAPRLLTKTEAAAYCGVSVPIFSEVCAVNPISLGEGVRLKRWDVRDLDEWIDRKAGRSPPSADDLLERWDAYDRNGDRERRNAERLKRKRP